MRAFIGISFTKEVIDYLEKVKSDLLKYTIKANPTRKENFHLTLLFIGDIDLNKQKKIEVALNKVSSISKFNIKLDELGTFNKGKNSIAWIGIKEGLSSLNSLHKSIIESFNDFGFNSSYQPHITIARNVIFNDELNKINIDKYPNLITIDKIHLYESHQVNGVLTYTIRKTIYLKDK